MNEILVESLLKLQKIGTESIKSKGPPTEWEFFFRNELSLFRFFFDSERGEVDFKILKFRSVSDIHQFLDAEYARNRSRFVLYEMDETQIFMGLEMPFLLSTSCRDLPQTLKTVFKDECCRFYLYDPLEQPEFEYFARICLACERSEDPKDEFDKLLNISKSFGYLLRPTFSCGQLASSIDNMQAIAKDQLLALSNWSPLNISQSVNTLVGAKFNLSKEFRELLNLYGADKDTRCLDFYHHPDNWRLEFLTYEIACKVGQKITMLPEDMSHQEYLFQIQEAANIFGGSLRKPIETMALPSPFKIENWTFYVCNSSLYKSSFDNKIPLIDCKKLEDSYKTELISKFPETSYIRKFQGTSLKAPFSSLSSEYLYKSSFHNGVLYDAMSADPVNKRLFFFQSTTNDPLTHGCTISAFLTVMDGLSLTPGAVDEVYYYMLTSAHVRPEVQHLFYFELTSLVAFHCCHLSDYAKMKDLLLNKIFVKGGKQTNITRIKMSKQELDELGEKVQPILRTIRCCYESEGRNTEPVRASIVRGGIQSQIKRLQSLNVKNPVDITDSEVQLLKDFGVILRRPTASMKSKTLEDKRAAVMKQIEPAAQSLFISMENQSFDLDGLSPIEKKLLSAGGFTIKDNKLYSTRREPDVFYKVLLSDNDYETIRRFLEYSDKIKPIICRTSFLSTTTTSV